MTDDSQLEAPPKLLLLIGAVALQWSRVEWTLKRLIIGLCAKDGPTGLVVTDGLGFRSITHVLLSVCDTAVTDHKTFVSDLRSLLTEANRLSGARNMLIHNTWPGTRNDDEFVALIQRFKGKARLHEEIWTGEQIFQIRTEIEELLWALTEFIILHDLNQPFDDWNEKASHETPPQPRFAQPLSRDPKIEAVMSQLLSSRE